MTHNTFPFQSVWKYEKCVRDIIQGCIIIRGYTTVHVEPLNENQSNFFWIIPSSSANLDVLDDTFEGRIHYIFVCEWIFEELCQYMCFHIYMHNVRRMEIIIDEWTVSSFFLLLRLRRELTILWIVSWDNVIYPFFVTNLSCFIIDMLTMN